MTTHWVEASPTGNARVIRPRLEDDLSALERLLGEQQPLSQYPNRWPLPMPVRDFIIRQHEVAAWTCVLNGVVAGHVSVQSLTNHTVGQDFSDALGEPVENMNIVSALFVAQLARGRGVGSALLQTAVNYCRRQDVRPVLDVALANKDAVALYRYKGWREIGRFRPDWLQDGEPDVLMMTLDLPADAATAH